MDKLVELKKGDNDSSKKWGGSTLNKPPVYTVKDLQKDLKTAGTFTDSENGIFGPKTEKALKIFQWACANFDKCIKNKVTVTRTKKASIIVNGILNKATNDELKVWVKNNQVVTGDLIRIPFSDLTNIEAGPSFKKLSSAKVFKDEIVISKEAKNLLTDLNEKAKDKTVTIKINQAFREHGVKVTGAVVTPANKSQHLIGHALDCNIVDGSSWNNSSDFKNKKQTKNAKEIVDGLKKSGYRWGGDFTPADTPHFDSQINSATFAFDAKFFLNQRMVSEGHDISKGKP
jgi:hypothetical protein